MMDGSAHPAFEVRGENVSERFCGDPTKWPFGPLKPFSYELIMIDPPWPTEMRSPKGEKKSHARYYGSMSFADIHTLPVGQLAAPHCIIFLWCTWPLLFHGGDPKRHFTNADSSYSPVGACLKRWGARYVTGGVWHKKTPHGKTAFGPGYRARSACEPFLLGVIGAPKNSRSERNLIEGLARAHSVKPEEAYAWCERYMPGARRVELFSRTSRPGWDTWGYEAGKFNATVTLQAEP
jgi:N6-adenosine-specific RNA methylase IME4